VSGCLVVWFLVTSGSDGVSILPVTSKKMNTKEVLNNKKYRAVGQKCTPSGPMYMNVYLVV